MPVLPTRDDMRRQNEGSVRRGWRDAVDTTGMWQIRVLFLFVAALGPGVTDHFTRLQLTPTVAAFSSVAGAVTLLMGILSFSIARAPYRQRTEARRQRDACEQARAPHLAMPYQEWAPLMKEQIIAGREVLARLTDDLAGAPFYQAYDAAYEWFRRADEILQKCHLEWRARVFEGRPHLWQVTPLSSRTIRAWLEEFLKRLEELVPDA
jgi:hypothetical protein